MNYSAETIDTSKIYWDVTKNIKNLKILEDELQNKLGNLKKVGNRYMYQSVDKETICSILQRIEFPYENTKLDSNSICKFLKESNRLNLWDVVIATGNIEAETRYFSFGGYLIPSVKRKFNYRKEDNEQFVRIAGTNNRLMDPGILNSGLDQETIGEVKNDSREKSKNPTAKDYLRKRKNPIFVIYPIDLKVELGETNKLEIKNQLSNNFLIGIGIGFPYNGEGISITYKLNKRKQEELEKERESMEDDDDE